MTVERTTPLRERMIKDTRIRAMGDKARQAHIRAIKDFAASAPTPPRRTTCAPTSFT
ncbi:hypothetical protein [Allomesorhizobium camelthorni]|uniref:hypothetical protein n=1 Tax=Allomesorhizobium camelthorni TaxID=475069 RepID=UPI001FEC077F|nr:hypothetical protein [Mesorhizobium camelthorni]